MGTETTHSPFSLPISDILCQTSLMKNLTAAICLTIAVLLGSAGVGQVRGLWRLGINPWKENNAR